MTQNKREADQARTEWGIQVGLHLQPGGMKQAAWGRSLVCTRVVCRPHQFSRQQWPQLVVACWSLQQKW